MRVFVRLSLGFVFAVGCTRTAEPAARPSEPGETVPQAGAEPPPEPRRSQEPRAEPRRPAAPVDVEKLRVLVAQLPSGTAEERDRAAAELRKLPIGAVKELIGMMSRLDEQSRQQPNPAAVAAFRILAYGESADVATRVSTVGLATISKEKLNADVLPHVVAAFRTSDKSGLAGASVALITISVASGGKVYDPLKKLADAEPEEVRNLIWGVMAEGLMRDGLARIASASDKDIAEANPFAPPQSLGDAYAHILVLRKIGLVAHPKVSGFAKEARAEYQRWDLGQQRMSLLATDEQWYQYRQLGRRIGVMKSYCEAAEKVVEPEKK